VSARPDEHAREAARGERRPTAPSDERTANAARSDAPRHDRPERRGATRTGDRAAPRSSHLDSRGRARMVDVGQKDVTPRRAVARGWVEMNDDALAVLETGAGKKGDALAAARIAGIMAAKRTPDLIPLCHQINLTDAGVRFDVDRDAGRVEIEAWASAVDRTGAEMEALTAVSVAALTLYDMCKSVDRGMVIGGVRLASKSGGRSGDYVRPGEDAPPAAEPSGEAGPEGNAPEDHPSERDAGERRGSPCPRKGRGD